MAEEIVNLFETTLAADLSNVATSMSITDTSGPGGALGTGGTWRFTIGRDSSDPEIVTGTARSGSTVTITRAQGGTSARAWAAGTKVTLSITKESVTALINDTAYHSGGTDVAVADGGTGASSASAARTNLGLVIGTDVPSYAAALKFGVANSGSSVDIETSGSMDFRLGSGQAFRVHDDADDTVFAVDDSGNPFFQLGTGGELDILDHTGTPVFSFLEDGTTVGLSGGSGDVATDTIWDAKGDLAAGTGADTASKLSVGANNKVLTADSGQSTGLKWQLTEDVEVKVIDDATTLTTGDGKIIFCIPASLGGCDLTAAHAFVTTNSSSGTPTVQIRNVTQTADMLSTRITIDANEPTSYTAATPPVIDTGNDDVATGDLIAIDVDVAGTGAKGLGVILTFTLP